MELFVDIIIVIITTFICSYIFSIIVLSAFFGIPQTIKLKKEKILLETASIKSYLLSIALWCFFVFIVVLCLFNILSEEYFIAVVVGMIIALLNSLKSLSKENYKTNMEELLKIQSKHINHIINKIYDYSLDITENLNKLLTGYSYNNYIDDNRNLFVAISCMHCFYFFETLLGKDYNYNSNQCFVVIHCLLLELHSHIEEIDFQTIVGAYGEVKKLLGYPQIDDENQLPEYVACVFLSMALQNFDLEEIETTLLYDIYNEFNNIIENKYSL